MPRAPYQSRKSGDDDVKGAERPNPRRSMVAGVPDLGQVVEDVATMSAGPGRIVVPPPVFGTSNGGVYDVHRAVCEPLRPDRQMSVDDTLPVGERIAKAFVDLFDQLSADDLVAAALLPVEYRMTMLSLLNPANADKLAEYLEAAGLAYSDYVYGYFRGYYDLLMVAARAEAKLVTCGLAAVAFGGLQLMKAIEGEDIDFETWLGLTAGACPEIYTVLTAAAKVEAFYTTLRDNPLEVLLAAVEVLAEVTAAALELLRDSDVLGKLKAFANDHKAIGTLHGTLLGFVIADIVIDSLVSRGAGKLLKVTRYIVKPAP